MRGLSRYTAWLVPVWLSVLGCSLGPQRSTVTFDRSWKGNWRTSGQSVEQTPDHGYVIGALWSADSSATSTALIRTDSLGETLWTRRFPLDEGGYACVTRDGGFVVVGSASFKSGHHAGQRGMVIKVGAHGQVQWQHELADNHRMWCEAVAATDDGGCIVGGMLDGIYQTWLLKLTVDGSRS